MRKSLSKDPAAEALGRAGAITRQPLVWVGATALMAATCGRKGRRAALRGSACYVLGAAAGNLLKPVFGRPQPRHRRLHKPEVVRGSFPSGHAAAEVAYAFGVRQELPLAFLPLAAMALLGHWSLVRAGKHYVSDTLVGGTIGLALATLTGNLWRVPSVSELAPRSPWKPDTKLTADGQAQRQESCTPWPEPSASGAQGVPLPRSAAS